MNRTWFDGILEASIRSTKIKSYWPLWLSMHLILHQVGRTHKVVHGKAARFRHLPTACQRRVRWQATVSLRARWALRCYLHVAIGIELAIARSRKDRRGDRFRESCDTGEQLCGQSTQFLENPAPASFPRLSIWSAPNAVGA